MIYKVHIYHNGMVGVFDKDGNNMVQFQGELSKVKIIIVKNCDAETKFYETNWLTKVSNEISRETFLTY